MLPGRRPFTRYQQQLGVEGGDRRGDGVGQALSGPGEHLAGGRLAPVRQRGQVVEPLAGSQEPGRAAGGDKAVRADVGLEATALPAGARWPLLDTTTWPSSPAPP